MSAVVRIVVLAAVVGLLTALSCSGLLPKWPPGRRLQRPRSRRARGDGDGEMGVTGVNGEPIVQPESPTSFEALFSPDDRRELEAAFAEAHSQVLDELRERASEAAARLRTSAVPVYEVCSTGAGHRAETLRVRFADGTTVVLCCRGSSGSYWVQALRRQILSGSVVLDRMTFGLAGPVVVFGTPAGEVFVMADLVTIGS